MPCLKQFNDAESWAAWNEAHQGQGKSKTRTIGGVNVPDFDENKPFDAVGANLFETPQIESIQTYLKGNSTELNGYLFGSRAPTPAVEAHLEEMDKIFNDTPRVKEDMTLYRVIDADRTYKMSSELSREGAEVRYRGFMSTTRDEQYVNNFKEYATTERPISIVKISLPKDSARAIDCKMVSAFKNEREVLVNRDTKFAIKSVSNDGKIINMHWEAIEE
jgi:hypothetical protein